MSPRDCNLSKPRENPWDSFVRVHKDQADTALYREPVGKVMIRTRRTGNSCLPCVLESRIAFAIT